MVERAAFQDELVILEEQLSNCRDEVLQIRGIAESWELQHQSAVTMAERLEQELTVRERLEEDLRQRLEAQQIRAEKAEGKLFWKQVERFLQGAAVGGNNRFRAVT